MFAVSRTIEKGREVGFRFAADHPEYLGWILVQKTPPNLRILEQFSEAEQPWLVRPELEKQRKPYSVLVIELQKTVHESGEYEWNADYRRRELHRFASTEEVRSFLVEKWGLDLDDAQDRDLLDAP